MLKELLNDEMLKKALPYALNYFGVILNNETKLSSNKYIVNTHKLLQKEFIKNKGSGLENSVARIYKILGYEDVQQNIKLQKKIDGQISTSQIDLTYIAKSGFLKIKTEKRFVECKYKQKDNVTLAEVAKFGEVLISYNIPLTSGEIITNQDFDIRSKEYSKRTGIVLIDGRKLEQLSKKSQEGMKKIYAVYQSVKNSDNTNFIDLFNYVLGSHLSIDNQIKIYSK